MKDGSILKKKWRQQDVLVFWPSATLLSGLFAKGYLQFLGLLSQ